MVIKEENNLINSFMKPEYTKFTEMILNEWKADGITHIRSEVLNQDDEFGAESAVEITPEYASHDDINTESIDSEDVHNYARMDSLEVVYVVKKKNV